MAEQVILERIKRIKAISDVGLLYASNDFERERYEELLTISIEMLEQVSGIEKQELQLNFLPVKEYPTVKVDVRGFLLSGDGKILMVKEKADNKWSLPGGWADIGYTPKEVVVKEFREETGLEVTPERLLAVFDKKVHDHPPQPFYIYKLVILCKALSEKPVSGFEVSDVAYFSIDELPELSEDRILKSQLQMLYDQVSTGNRETYFD